MKIYVEVKDLESLYNFVSKEARNNTYEGIYVCKRNGLLNMVATNGVALMVLERELKADEVLEDDESIIIPQTNFYKKTKQVIRIDTRKGENCTEIVMTKVDKTGQSQMVLPHIEGRYPDYTTVLVEEKEENKYDVFIPINPDYLVKAQKVIGQAIYFTPYSKGGADRAKTGAKMWTLDNGIIKYYIVILPVRP